MNNFCVCCTTVHFCVCDFLLDLIGLSYVRVIAQRAQLGPNHQTRLDQEFFAK